MRAVSGHGGVFHFDSKLGKIVEGRSPQQRRTTKWPIHSDSMGVAPSQAKDLEKFLASRGVPTEVDSDGNPVLTGPRHRKRVAEARGFYDRNGGYSDPAPVDDGGPTPVERLGEFFD